MTTFKLITNDNQEAFDLVCRHLASMTERATAAPAPSRCLYLTADGNRCAVGVLIDPSAEGYDADLLREVRGDVHSFIGGWAASALGIVAVSALDIGDIDEELLSALQGAHDNRANWDADGFNNWGKLEVIARRFGLNTTVLNEVRKDKALV